MDKAKITIAIIDDHRLFRAGISELLSNQQDIEVVFEADNGVEMQASLKNSQVIPDIVLMDVNMPHMDGYESSRWLKKHYPGIGILALSMLDEEDTITRMLQSGSGGYLLKNANPEDLVTAVREIAYNGSYLNNIVTAKFMRSVKTGNISVPPLSSKELEFLRLCCTPMSYSAIATEMNISVNTLEKHRAAVFRKLDLPSRPGVMLYAIKNGLVKV
ncbi:response regulator transcription factor [Daejeonella lutea]|uniref:response regulator transcription factor n=1 Tax=Daejeonella lutea TaxID=572036 RepID=UPI0011172E67|nr:response regulator transcription factor [Daejeonella lutea]